MHLEPFSSVNLICGEHALIWKMVLSGVFLERRTAAFSLVDVCGTHARLCDVHRGISARDVGHRWQLANLPSR